MLDDPSKKQAKMWREIANVMNDNGHDVTADQAKKKWDNMKARYVSLLYSAFLLVIPASTL
jgi:hypothetical protein